jgi:hypothetical protein
MTEKNVATEKTASEKNKKLDEQAEQTAAEVEPMGSVAAAVPRDAGSAIDENCENTAPDHEGGHGTLVAGEEAHEAENPPHRKLPTAKKHER